MQKILLADDERDVRSLLQSELEQAGYRVTAVATGAEAVIAAADGGHGGLVAHGVDVQQIDDIGKGGCHLA